MTAMRPRRGGSTSVTRRAPQGQSSRRHGAAVLVVERADTVDPRGHPPLSLYVETFYCPLVGGNAMALYRQLARVVESADRASLPVHATAASIGLNYGDPTALRSPFARALGRLRAHRLVALSDEPFVIPVPPLVPQLTERQVLGLPPHLASIHRRFHGDQP